MGGVWVQESERKSDGASEVSVVFGGAEICPLDLTSDRFDRCPLIESVSEEHRQVCMVYSKGGGAQQEQIAWREIDIKPIDTYG